MKMGEKPPPLPPKLRGKYSEEDKVRALEEEKMAFENLRKQKLGKTQSHCFKLDKDTKSPKKLPASFSLSRPTPQPRSVNRKLDNKLDMKIDQNKNISDSKLTGSKEDDLMSFVSPEKANGFNDALKHIQDLNMNRSNNAGNSVKPKSYLGNCINQPSSFNHLNLSLSAGNLSSSKSFPYAMNSMINNSSMWNPVKNTSSLGSSNLFPNFYHFSNSFSNSQFNLQPEVQIRPTISSVIPPPLPNRSPVLDISRLSMNTNLAVNNQSSTQLVPFSQSSSVVIGSVGIPQLQRQEPSSTKNSIPFSKNSSIISLPQSVNVASNKLSATVTAACDRSILQKFPINNKLDNSKDLIDLQLEKTGHSKKYNLFYSVLEDFDPLINKKPECDSGLKTYNSIDEITLSAEAKELLDYKRSSKKQDDDQSYYEQVDPFQYMNPGAASIRSDPLIDIYDGLASPKTSGSETFDIPPPLPQKQGKGKKEELVLRRHSRVDRDKKEKKRVVTVYDGRRSDGKIHLRKMDALLSDNEAISFWNIIKKLRSEYSYDDRIGNPGLLHSPCLEAPLDLILSVKLHIFYKDIDPVMFTCNLNTTIEHVVLQSLTSFDDSDNDSSNFLLKVRGIDEYLCGDSQLGEYEYVHDCIKYDKDLLFTLVSVQDVNMVYLRTEEDDRLIEETSANSLLKVGATDAIYFDSLVVAVEAFESESSKLHESGFKLLEGTPNHELPSPMRSRQLRQVVKQICALLGELETVQITESINYLIETTKIIQKSQGILDGESDVPGQTSGMMLTGSVQMDTTELQEKLSDALSRLCGALNAFLTTYSRAFRVDFEVEKFENFEVKPKDISVVRERIKVEVSALHRIPTQWCQVFDGYFVEAQIFHGTRSVGQSQYTEHHNVENDPKFYQKVVFSQTLDMEARVNTLPRECRLVFTLYGVRKIVNEGKDFGENRFIREEIGWAAIQMFSFDGYLSSGRYILTLWPMVSDKRLSPAPRSSDHPKAHLCPILTVELPDYGYEVYFPEITPNAPNKQDFEQLDANTQQQLRDVFERDIFTFNKSSIEEREILWEKRHYLYEVPEALAHVLLSADSWDVDCLGDLHSMVVNWAPMNSSDAMVLLLPSFPDTVVRKKAVDCISALGSDELIGYLPQLVQAVKHEAWDISKLCELLLERALTSPRVAHHLYWLFNQCLPLESSFVIDREIVADARYSRRLNMVTRALMIICGKNMEARLLRQEALLRTLYETALLIKDTKDSQRMYYLQHELQNTQQNLMDCPTSLPLSPSFEVAGVDLDSCSYYTSFTTPLRLVFTSSERNTPNIHTIFKVGDDLRQDMLVIQMIRVMDRLWLKEGLDLKIVTFNVIPTGDRIGILEMVKEAETLRKIQIENGLTGSFKERPIAEWLAKQNPSQLEYQRAVNNFTASCAGYCVATYILGICDRHNDNIMLKTSGHLFHIDFGRFLGDAQKFGNVKRDRTPFVLTTDMAYVINGGDRPSNMFQSFVDLCCKAFNIVRQNAHLLLYLFALMASSGIPGVTAKAVDYVEKALLQDKTNAEAGAFFARMIQESLKNWFTQVNFFIHNLAQLRFSGDHSNSENPDSLLSFVPHTYTMSQEGKIERVGLYSFQKRYNPFKYYVYILKVQRENQCEPSFLFRSYKEFSEFHQKLCYSFPLAKIHSLPKGVQVGRSEVKSVAERRKLDIELFLATVFCLSEEISHSDLVYTFLHPLLRDQEDADIHLKKLKYVDSSTISSQVSRVASILGPFKVQGQVKVSLQYIRGQLQIVIQHARNLAHTVGSPEPSPYVKLYLLPDSHKRTKRKTKVVKKSCHPTFMEIITYRMGLDAIKTKVLEVSVWSEDKLSENYYLGSAYLKLSKLNWKEETCEWLSLESNIKTAREHVLFPTFNP